MVTGTIFEQHPCKQLYKIRFLHFMKSLQIPDLGTVTHATVSVAIEILCKSKNGYSPFPSSIMYLRVLEPAG